MGGGGVALYITDYHDVRYRLSSDTFFSFVDVNNFTRPKNFISMYSRTLRGARKLTTFNIYEGFFLNSIFMPQSRNLKYVRSRHVWPILSMISLYRKSCDTAVSGHQVTYKRKSIVNFADASDTGNGGNRRKNIIQVNWLAFSVTSLYA